MKPWTESAAYVECVMLADATQGGISLTEAMDMTHDQRHGTFEVLKDIRERQVREAKRASR